MTDSHDWGTFLTQTGWIAEIPSNLAKVSIVCCIFQSVLDVPVSHFQDRIPGMQILGVETQRTLFEAVVADVYSALAFI